MAVTPPVEDSWFPQIKRLVLFARPHWKGALLSVVVITLNAAMVGAFYLVVERLIRPIIGAKDLSKLFHAATLLGVISIGRFVTDALYVFLSNGVSQRIIRDLRAELFSHLHRLSLGYLESRKTGELMSRVINDVANLQSLMVSQIIEGLRSFITLIAVFCVMLQKSWELTFLAILGIPVVAFTIYKASRRVRRISQQVQEQLAEVSSVLQESLTLMPIIQSFGMEHKEIERFEAFNSSVYRRTMRGIRIQAFLAPFVELIGVFGFLVAMLIGGWFVIQSAITPERLLAFLITVPYAVSRFKILSGLHVAFVGAAAAIQRVFEVLDTEPEIREKPDAISLPRSQGKVQFDHVSFSYRTGGEVLQDVSFAIEPGQIIGLAGISGSGKTTIAKLLLRLYDVTCGCVRINDHDVRDITLRSLRDLISVVPQETLLFGCSVRENIAFARPDATEDQIREAAARANAHEFIINLPEGYDTLVGERGTKLSGGQRQRIAIARALLRDPQILILDEATSSLDAESESLVQEAFQRLMENRTTIVITHRFSTIQSVNRILVLSKGRIVEQGSHQQLISANGLYRRLYDFQRRWDEPPDNISRAETEPH